MSNSGSLGFFAGAVIGAALGVVAGVLIAPRAGYETRGMAADVATDAWGEVVDRYHQAADETAEKVTSKLDSMGANSDELRAKVDQARMRMDQIRESLVGNASHDVPVEPDSVDVPEA